MPVEASKGDQLTGDRLAIGDQPLVIDFQKTIGWQHLTPMMHDSVILLVREDKIGLVADERIACKNVKYMDRQVSTG